jgi:phage-related protein
MPTFTYVPDFPAQESTTPRVSRLAYPNYEQRTTFGLNPLQDSWSLTFSGRTAADRDGIYSFLQARAGTEPFQWETPFGETGSFICSSWSTTLDSCDYSTIAATFEVQYVPAGPNLTLPAAPAVAFSYKPEFSAQQSFDSRARVTAFGDGYRQRVVFGLQPQEEAWRLSFQNRTNAERGQIRDYLRGAKGVTAFAWTDPRSGQAARFVCDEWSIEYVNFNNSNIDATFRRVFEP